MTDVQILPASVSHVSNESISSTLNAACSNATELFEAVVLSQLAIILKNQEEVKSRISKMEGNLAQVAAAHRSKMIPTPLRNLKQKRDQQQLLPKNKKNLSVGKDHQQLRQLQVAHQKPIVSLKMNNCIPQPLNFSVARDSVVSQAIKTPANYKDAIHDPPVITKESDAYHQPVVVDTLPPMSQDLVDSAPQSMQEDIIPSHDINNASLEQHCDGHTTATPSQGTMSAIHPVSMLTPLSSLQQPLTAHPLSRLNMSSSQQQTTIETTLSSQAPPQEHIAKDMSATPCQIDEGSLQGNTGVEDAFMSTDDLIQIQQTLNIHETFRIMPEVKPDGKIYSIPQPVKKQFNEQHSTYDTVSTGQCIVKEEPKNFDFSYQDLLYLKKNSLSIKNFAKKLSQKVYTLQELKTSNCCGTKGKRKLDPDRLMVIKKAVFDVYEIAVDEQKSTWQHCQNAINAFCRLKPNKYNY